MVKVNDMERAAQAQKQSRRGFKAKRQEEYARKGAAQEVREGTSDNTDCELDDNANLIKDPSPSAPTTLPSEDDAVIIYLYLETTNFSRYCEIIKIAAKADQEEFLAYILPQQRNLISKSTKLTVDKGLMFENGQQVNTTLAEEAFLQLLDFMKRCGRESVILAAHNGIRFHARNLLRVLRKLMLLEQFFTVVKGFVDTIEVFKATLPEKKGYSLTALAEFYKINSKEADDAIGGVRVRILSGIVAAAQLDKKSVMRHAKTMSAVIQKIQVLATNKEITTELQKLRPYVSSYIISRLGSEGITLKKLQEVYQSGGDVGLGSFLGESVNNKTRITKNKNVVHKIVEAMKTVADSQ